MKKHILTASIILLYCLICVDSSSAFWVWTPKTKKLINPKYATKDTPEEQFKWAMSFYKEKDYLRAADEFERLAAHFKDSDLAPKAQYYAGLSYEEGGKDYQAFQAYQKTIDLYPFTTKIDEIMGREYEIGIRFFNKHRAKLMGKEIMTDLDRAAEIFQKVKENAPFGEFGVKSQFMIGECYKKSEQYGEATKAFQKVLDEYPQSNLATKAKYEVAQCTYLASLRPDYDQELTDEAIKEFKRIAETKKGLTESEEAETAVLRLEEKKAQSLFNTAKFYERQKHYRSAAIYYGEIVKKYPHSSLSELALEAFERNESLAGLADEKEKNAALRKSGKKGKKWIFF